MLIFGIQIWKMPQNEKAARFHCKGNVLDLGSDSHNGEKLGFLNHFINRDSGFVHSAVGKSVKTEIPVFFRH